MSGNSDLTSFFQGEIKQAIYSVGMEDAVVDLVVIQWIMQKLKLDRCKRAASLGSLFVDS